MISTEKGQSGAPIIAIDKNNNLMIIGVHKGGLHLKDEQFKKDNGERVEIANVGKLFDRATL